MKLTRIRVAALAAAALVVMAVPAALAQPASTVWPAALQGQPSLQIQSQAVYYIWQDSAGWHVRWATPFAALFTGVLSTNGAFQNARGTGVTTMGQRLVFAHLAFAGVNGFDFQTTGTTGSTLTFSLSLNQGLIAASRVFLGRSGVNPSSMPFTVYTVAVQVIRDDEGREGLIRSKEDPER